MLAERRARRSTSQLRSFSCARQGSRSSSSTTRARSPRPSSISKDVHASPRRELPSCADRSQTPYPRRLLRLELRSWKQEFYGGKPARLWLEHYARHFDTVEVNNTFYRLPNRAAVENWERTVPRRLPLHDQGVAVPDARQAAAATSGPGSNASTSVSSRCSRPRRWARFSGSCRRPSGATTSVSRAPSAACRAGSVTPSSSVTRRGSPTTSTHCCGSTAPRLQSATGPRFDRSRRSVYRRLDARPLSLRVARAARQLQRVGAP